MLNKNLVPILLITSIEAMLLGDIFPPEGWHFGEGMVFRLEDTKMLNDTFFDRIAMRVDYGDVAVSAVPKPEEGAVQLDFYVKQEEEGRSKKMGNMLLPFMAGAIKGSVLTLLLGTVKLMVMKSLILTKLALVVSVAIVLCKFLKKSEVQPSYLGGEDHFPSFEYQGYGGTGSYSSNALNYAPYASEYPSIGAESAVSFAVAAPPVGNESVPPKLALPAAKRRYTVKRKVVPTVVTMKKYVEMDSGII